MQKLIEKASVLMEALPYIRKFHGKTIVIKYGGAAMMDENLKNGFARDVVLMDYIGLNPVIVHGGGPQIGRVLEKMGIESKFHNGMRITDERTMDVVEMVLAGDINGEIVNLITRNGGKAVGLSGKDGGLIKARKIPKEKIEVQGKDPQIIDYGRVGQVMEIDSTVISTLDSGRFIPVISPIGVNGQGVTLNINADLVAGEIAKSLKAEKLVLLTDIEGVQGREKELISSLTVNECRRFIKDEVIRGGMIPKVKCALKAVESGVKSAHIIDGRLVHALLLEIFTDKGVGTIIR
jgi:acetylglutamate kinase